MQGGIFMFKANHKPLRSLICISFLSLSLVGCGTNEDQNAFKPALDTNTTANISIQGHYDNFEAIDEQIDTFKSFYPNVTIKYDKVDNYTKETVINNLFLGDNAPDIYFVNNSWENDSRYAKLMENAEDLSAKETGIDISNVREGLIYKDKENHVPFVPIFTNAFGMIVNEELFSKNHLKIPKTYQDLISVCNSFKDLGYDSPVMSYKGSIFSLYFPHFMGNIAKDKDGVKALNDMDENAGEKIRSSLELASDFLSYEFIDKEKCIEEIAKDNTDSICYRIYEGDVPIIFTEVNRLSGSNKREAKSEAYQAHSFPYSFQPIPTFDKGGYYYNTLTLSFAVNKESKNLKMTNEFMRFLIRSDSLNKMSANKRQISPAKVLGDDKLFNSFKDVLNNNQVVYNYEIGLSTEADIQVRKTFDAFLNGASIDEAIHDYGTY